MFQLQVYNSPIESPHFIKEVDRVFKDNKHYLAAINEEKIHFNHVDELNNFIDKNPHFLKKPSFLAKVILENLIGMNYQLINDPEEYKVKYEELRSKDNFLNPFMPSSAFEEYNTSVITKPNFKNGHLIFYITKCHVPYKVFFKIGSKKINIEMLE